MYFFHNIFFFGLLCIHFVFFSLLLIKLESDQKVVYSFKREENLLICCSFFVSIFNAFFCKHTILLYEIIFVFILWVYTRLIRASEPRIFCIFLLLLFQIRKFPIYNFVKSNVLIYSVCVFAFAFTFQFCVCIYNLVLNFDANI